jgi:hypothetical protein
MMLMIEELICVAGTGGAIDPLDFSAMEVGLQVYLAGP